MTQTAPALLATISEFKDLNELKVIIYHQIFSSKNNQIKADERKAVQLFGRKSIY